MMTDMPELVVPEVVTIWNQAAASLFTDASTASPSLMALKGEACQAVY
jgi:hypothetical protein